MTARRQWTFAASSARALARLGPELRGGGGGRNWRTRSAKSNYDLRLFVTTLRARASSRLGRKMRATLANLLIPNWPLLCGPPECAV